METLGSASFEQYRQDFGNRLARLDTKTNPIADWPSRWAARRCLVGMTVNEVAVNDDHVCARSDSRGHCWGDNTWGQLCDGTTTSITTPREVPGASDVAAIAVSWETTRLAHSELSGFFVADAELGFAVVAEFQELLDAGDDAVLLCPRCASRITVRRAFPRLLHRQQLHVFAVPDVLQAICEPRVCREQHDAVRDRRRRDEKIRVAEVDVELLFFAAGPQPRSDVPARACPFVQTEHLRRAQELFDLCAALDGLGARHPMAAQLIDRHVGDVRRGVGQQVADSAAKLGRARFCCRVDESQDHARIKKHRAHSGSRLRGTPRTLPA